MSVFFLHLMPAVLLAYLPLETPVPQDNEYAEKLQAIGTEYAQLGASPNITTLLRLDQKLRDLVPALSEIEMSRGIFFYRDEYRTMGLIPNHWSGTLEYDGTLLKIAHKLNPNSPQRNRTLFSTVARSDSPDKYNGMPNINAAYQYISEFPEGPFAADTFETLATFYDDFYKVLRRFVVEDPKDDDFFFLCFKPYLTEQSYGDQLIQVRALGLHFYECALKYAENNERTVSRVKEKRDRFRKMFDATDVYKFSWWYWCSDC